MRFRPAPPSRVEHRVTGHARYVDARAHGARRAVFEAVLVPCLVTVATPNALMALIHVAVRLEAPQQAVIGSMAARRTACAAGERIRGRRHTRRQRVTAFLLRAEQR
jgi:hypothetical protein